jgi:regulator of replication initiation timing
MSIVQTAKDVYALAQKGLTIELQEKVMELREQALALQEENLTLRSELSAIREQLEQKKKLEFDGLAYKGSDGWYCATCHDKDSKFIRLLPNQNSAVQARFYCNVCKSFF